MKNNKYFLKQQIIKTKNFLNYFNNFKIKFIDNKNENFKIWKLENIISKTQFIWNISGQNDLESLNQYITEIKPFDNEIVTIDWGDDEKSFISNYQYIVKHTYKVPNKYTVTISDNVEKLKIAKFSDFEIPETSILKIISLGNRIKNLENCFNFCINLKEIPHWGIDIENVSGCYGGCINLENPVEWSKNIENVSFCYYFCKNLKTIVPWNKNIKNAESCYGYCESLKNVFTIDKNNLMPNYIINHKHCFSNSGISNFFENSWI